MKAHLSKSLIPAVLVIAGLAAGTGLLAGYVDGPSKAPQAVAQIECDGCPRLNTPECCKVTGVCADPQNCKVPCTGMAAKTTPCAAMSASTTPCSAPEGCASACTAKPCENPASGCTQEPHAAPCPATGCPAEKPQTTGCPFMNSSSPAASPCGAGGCTLAK